MMSFPAPTELMPHAGRAVMIDEVLANSIDAVTVAATVTTAHPWFVPGRGVPVWVGMEMMAQAVAVHSGLHSRSQGGRVGGGMLLGTRHFDGRVPWFADGQRLVIHAEHAFGRAGEGMAACDCRIETDDCLLARATLIILEGTRP